MNTDKSVRTPDACPFCGAPGKHRFAKNAGLHWVECTGCEADGPAIYDYEQAIAAWNRRAPRPDGLQEALEQARNDLDHLAFNIVREDGEAMTQEGAGNFAQKAYERASAALAGVSR